MTKERHLKSRRQETWTDLRTELDRVSKELNLQNDFAPLDLPTWPSVKEKIWNKFIDQSKSGWIWERLKFSYESIHHSKGFLYLDQLIDKDEEVWFFVNETVGEHTKYWFYTGKIKAIETVIMESVGIDEFSIVSKKYDWLLCYNHHDILIGTGEYIEARLRELKSKLGEI